MSIPFNSQQGLVIFPVDIYGPAGAGVARLALDTGSIETTISRRALKAVGIDPAQASLGSVPVITGSGRVSVPLVRLMRLDALGQQRIDFKTGYLVLE